ncbi:MAG: 4Fe-4S binding protein [Ignavibacteriaceae bacterium]|nr:4Fe-4S binding protein [Ignavibacteriaceae bacterium]
MKEKKKIIRNNEKPIQRLRFTVQILFAALCIWIGVEFYLFVRYLETGGTVFYFNRPPGVDGFLPISSLMSFYYFISTGVIHSAHPAGMFIFLAIVLMSLVVGKSFCSWMCPIGFLSELVGDFGEKLFKRKIILPKFLDYPLRSLKYLLLGFFLYSIFYIMTTAAIKAFLDSPYNLVADVKMYYFFADISQLSLIVISVLFLLSIVVRNFWCRYLCPYGALLGIASLISPVKIKRNTASCIDCNLCAKACPSNIKVDKVKTVLSDECTSCLNCIDACPVSDTLHLHTFISKKKKISKKTAAIAIVLIFMAVTGVGMLTGNWQNNLTKEEYLLHYNYMGSYGHPTGAEGFRKLNEQTMKDEKDHKINSNKN